MKKLGKPNRAIPVGSQNPSAPARVLLVRIPSCKVRHRELSCRTNVQYSTTRLTFRDQPKETSPPRPPGLCAHQNTHRVRVYLVPSYLCNCFVCCSFPTMQVPQKSCIYWRSDHSQLILPCASVTYSYILSNLRASKN